MEVINLSSPSARRDLVNQRKVGSTGPPQIQLSLQMQFNYILKARRSVRMSFGGLYVVFEKTWVRYIVPEDKRKKKRLKKEEPRN